jgi:hypothetical protein
VSFPRFALAGAGNRLFIADGGNDRVLVYNHIPTQSGETADFVIGQLGGTINQASDAADSLRTPMSLAWDGTNLYVSDTYNRRVMIYSPAEPNIPQQGVRNAASPEIFALAGVTLGGTIQADDVVTVTINGTAYTYKVLKADTFDTVVNALVSAINGAFSITYENECAGGTSFTQSYQNQVVIANGSCGFQNSGDSGSLLLEDVATNPRAVGLCFAGSSVCNGSSIAIANPIGAVLSKIGCTMVGL